MKKFGFLIHVAAAAAMLAGQAIAKPATSAVSASAISPVKEHIDRGVSNSLPSLAPTEETHLLLMRLPESETVFAAHRSHRSHRSHYSHRSSR